MYNLILLVVRKTSDDLIPFPYSGNLFSLKMGRSRSNTSSNKYNEDKNSRPTNDLAYKGHQSLPIQRFGLIILDAAALIRHQREE